MSVLRFSVGEMIYVLKYMLEDTAARGVINSVPMLQLMIPHLEKSLQLLENSRGNAAVILSPEQKKKVKENLSILDWEHDQAYRYLNSMLDLVIQHTTVQKTKQQAEEVLQALLPFGLRIVQMKYVDEAGEAKRLETQLRSTKVQDFLKGILFGVHGAQTNALEQAQKIVKVGAELHTELMKLEGVKDSSLVRDARQLFFHTLKRFMINARAELSQDLDRLEILFSAYEEKLKDNKAPEAPAKSEAES